MANQGQLDLLAQDLDAWNQWRIDNKHIIVDLSEANLGATYIRGADLSGANLKRANLSKANLVEADLSFASLEGADLSECDLSDGNLKRADLKRADLSRADLNSVNLNEANFQNTVVNETNLYAADFSGALISGAIFSNIDLSEARGLKNTRHFRPSTIGTDTVYKSKGSISAEFLRGCGLADWEIESSKLYAPNLSNEDMVKIQYRVYDLRATQAIQISPLFISYSHGDKDFVDKIDKVLTQKGVRFWRDTHDLISGRIETQIESAIRLNPTVLLVLSKNSLDSDWVEHEVFKARELEKELKKDILCPISLDDAWKSTHWPQRLMRQITEYKILDFSSWRDSQDFQSQFSKLLKGLNLFYKKPS